MGSLVSLVMSDIVDSTRRWNAAEGAMAADLELHDRLIREVVEGAGGSVFKHTGDGMIAVFDDPVAAVGAAAGIQRCIGDAQWAHPDGLQVRAAVHSGVVYQRDGDMFGTAVNKLARILSTCPPGAVLVSNAVAGLLTERSPEGLGVRAVGEVSLAGFSTPETVHAVTGSGVATVESLTAIADPTHRGGALPRIDDELLGRTDELAAIWEALGRARLVTLVGVGGMGKTRLALEVAAGGVDAFPGGVWWIDLTTATTSEAVLPVAMAAVGAREAPGRSALQSLCERFAPVTALVVIDNCEHVLPAVHAMVDALRTAAPELRVVATSREALGVRGEQLVPIGSLPADDSVTLFTERAAAVRPGLDPTSERTVIERLCARLDGIPLAIELAAARCRSMSPTEIDARLDDRFRLLRGGRAGAERHRTLQAAVAWSYELLDPDERTVFDQMAVFSGGTLIDGLVAVTGFDEFDVLDLVDRLVARSMAVVVDTPLGSRFHQLETLRQYAEDRLVEAGTIDATRNRHLLWAHALAREVDSWSGTLRGPDGFARSVAEVDNMRVAVAHAIATGRQATAHEVVAALSGAAISRPMLEVLDWVRPIRLDDDWTEAAAICVYAGWWADYFMRGLAPDEAQLRLLPDRFLTDSLKVLWAAAYGVLFLSGRWRELLDLLDQVPAETAVEKVRVDSLWLSAHFWRERFGGPGSVPSDDEYDAIRRRSSDAMERARRLGDECLVGRVAMTAGLALVSRWPDEALAYADIGFALAERHGMGPVRDGALAVRQYALGRLGQAAGDDPARHARQLRTAILRAVDEGNPGGAGLLMYSALSIIAASAPSDAITFLLIRSRTFLGLDVATELLRLGIDMPADLDDWKQRTAHLTRDDSVALLIAALDRVIAEAESAPGGES